MKVNYQVSGIVELDKGILKATLIPTEKRRFRKFMKIFIDALKMIDETKLHGQSLKILFAVIKHFLKPNIAPGTQRMSSILNIKQQSVSRAYKELVEVGFLEKKDRTYYLNPYIFFMGSDKEQEQFLRDFYEKYPLKPLTEHTSIKLQEGKKV